MTGREKIEAAFSPEGTPEIAVVICYEGIYQRDHWPQLTRQPWWALRSGDCDRHLAVWRDFIRNTGQDWFSLPFGPSRCERENIAVEESPDGVWQVDRKSGRRIELSPPQVGGWSGKRLHSPAPADPPETREAIDRILTVPASGEIDAPFENGAVELTRVLLGGEARDLFPMGGIHTPLWGCYGMWSFDEMMRKCIQDPELIHYACERHLQRILPAIRQQARKGCRGIWIEECMTDMISPAAFRALNLPYLKEVVRAIRDAGMASVYYYCGNPGDRLDLILESGADAISLEESKKGWRVDIDELADHVAGRAVLLGNLDAIVLLERGCDEELQAEIRRQTAAGRRNRSRFIMSIGSPVTPGTSTERVRRYCEIARALGK